MKKTITIILLLISSSSFSNTKSWYSDLISPVTTDAKYITMGGLAATLMVYSNKSNRTYRKRESFEESKPFNQYGIVGDIMGRGILNVTYAAGFLAHGYFSGNENSLNDGEHMAKASFYSTSLVMLTKFLVSERRPGYPDDDASFPSGHASASFAFASVVTARHGWYWGSVAYSMAGFISISRINDDYHYLHDVLVGATIGAAFGWGTYYNYQGGKPYFLAPILLDDGGGMNVSWNF